MMTKVINPAKETKRYEIEVYVSFTEGVDMPFVTAGVANAAYPVPQPSGDNVERYVFEVEHPATIKKPLKGGA